MTYGLGGPGSAPGPFHGELARSQIQHARAGAPRLPDDVIAAAREERSLRRLRRRIGRWHRLGRIR